MAQRYEDLSGEHSKSFYLQYAFPPLSVGEVGRMGSPGRREIGHGNLAERALRPALPLKDAFQYTVRVESLITESCGSSSMASVCAGCLSMLAAGVPLSRKVAGVAMGLLLDESGGGGEPIILSDILGSEDALGTMDFKVAGDTTGISAFQLDIKCEGLSLPLMRAALEQARQGRLHILELMEEAMPHAATLAEGVPRIVNLGIPPKMVGRLIGPGGATINAITSESGVDNIAIDKAGPGSVCITGSNDAAVQDAVSRIQALIDDDKPLERSTPPIKVGDAYAACEVKNIVPFGIFVSLRPGTDGFCHISELSEQYIRNIEDVCLSIGDKVDVVVSEINNNRYRIEVTSDFEIKTSKKPRESGGQNRKDR
jgi:polyribonucleotide nucleotidyltransferase